MLKARLNVSLGTVGSGAGRAAGRGRERASFTRRDATFRRRDGARGEAAAHDPNRHPSEGWGPCRVIPAARLVGMDASLSWHDEEVAAAAPTHRQNALNSAILVFPVAALALCHPLHRLRDA